MENNNYIQRNIRNLIADRLKQDLDEQLAEATQAISEIGGIDSRKAYSKVQERLQKERKFTILINTLSRVAAILFLPLLVASGILFFNQLNLKQIQQFALQEITTPVGVRSHVLLPDGSDVWLNAESTIKFKIPFDQTTRGVSLSGEAFFDVKKNPNVPFIVNTGNINIKVIGTRFNCKAFSNENCIEIVLAEGKVSLNLAGAPIRREIAMKPGDRAVIDKTSYRTCITNEKIEKYIAWHSGKLVFDETPMTEVATQIGRWFGVEVVIEDPKIRSYRITTTFEDESLHEVLELLSLSSPVEIKYMPSTINKSTNMPTKSKVIFSKKSKLKSKSL